MYYQVLKLSISPRVFLNLIIHSSPARFLNGFKISDLDQLILGLIFRFGVILAKKLDVTFSRVFIRYKDAH